MHGTRHGPKTGRRIVGGSGSGSGTAIGGSATALHAKTFVVDGRNVFVGSFNFDPRSARLNTELGLVIDSPTLGRQIDEAFTDAIPGGAYEVKLDQNGNLYWLERKGGQTVRHENEPRTTRFQRMAIGALSLLPIDWLL